MSHKTKKSEARRRINSLKRAYNPCNTGTRTMRSKKDYDRSENKVKIRSDDDADIITTNALDYALGEQNLALTAECLHYFNKRAKGLRETKNFWNALKEVTPSGYELESKCFDTLYADAFKEMRELYSLKEATLDYLTIKGLTEPIGVQSMPTVADEDYGLLYRFGGSSFHRRCDKSVLLKYPYLGDMKFKTTAN